MKVAVTGSSGMIGSSLAAALRADRHEVLRLVRRTPRAADERGWDPAERRLDPALLADVDAVVNLAGAPILPRPWTAGYKQALLNSRLDSTTTISEALAAADRRPRVLLSGSAVGYYGDTGERRVDESAPPGTDFLARLCVRWEAATAPAEQGGVRVVHVRTGLVLGHGARLLRVLAPIFRAGLGGRVGSGRQYWPWVALDDQVAAMRFLLTADVRGPVNVTGPSPATNEEFTRAFARVVHRPTVLAVPAFALNAALGEFSRSSITGGQRAVPAALQAAGFSFAYPDVESALRAALAKPARRSA